MSLRFALLGLLAVQPASGYDLKRAINRSTYFIWNATGPQIYNTLNTLREEGYISSVSRRQKGKPDKHVHTITPNGRAALKEFLGKPIRASVTRDEVLLRIFFGNFANKSTIKRELEAYVDRIGQERATMEHEARRFQLLSLRIKVAQIRAMEKELSRFLSNGARRAG
jgi:PadR family transcriptional regulator, regulatory protein AphA